jgi:NADH-quinone oxidoreductase subunit N
MMPDLSSALHLAAPELTLAIGALVLLVLGAFIGEKSARLISILSVALLIAASAIAATGPLGAAFHGAYVADPLAVYAKVVIYLCSAVAVILGGGWMQRTKIAKFEYPILIVLASVGMSMMASSGDLISLYVGIELHSLALYVLAAFHRDDLKASEAGLKYFVLGALSSGLLLYGASLIYGFTGSMRFEDIAAVAAGHVGAGLIFGLVFLISGLAFKVSAAPFHMWTPDVYEGAPTPVVALFATAPKVAAMVLIVRVLDGAFIGIHGQWAQVLVLISLISVRRRFVRRSGPEGHPAPAGLFLDHQHRLRPAGHRRRHDRRRPGHADVHDPVRHRPVRLLRHPAVAVQGRQADPQDRRSRRPAQEDPPGHHGGDHRPVAVGAGHAAVLGLLGQVLRLRRGRERGLLDGGGGGSGGLGRGGLLLSAHHQADVVRCAAGRRGTDAAPVESQWIAWACAAFTFPLVIVGLTCSLEPLAKAAAAGFGAG